MKEYQFIKELGKGGQGKVYLAKKLPAGILCAVKCIPKRSAKSCMLALREAELLKKLNHPAFPKIIDILEEDHEIRIVMEYVQGATLKRWALEERISVLQIERVFGELCEAIEYLHDQNPPIIFRDLKPENIMIEKDGLIRLVDFGAAKELDLDKGADTVYLGTAGYAAPEQYEGNALCDFRTDIYGLGKVLLFLYQNKDDNRADKKLERIIKRATANDQTDRYQNIRDVKKAFNKNGKYGNIIAVLCAVSIFLVLFWAETIKEKTGIHKETSVYHTEEATKESIQSESIEELLKQCMKDGKVTITEDKKLRKQFYIDADQITCNLAYDIAMMYLSSYQYGNTTYSGYLAAQQWLSYVEEHEKKSSGRYQMAKKLSADVRIKKQEIHAAQIKKGTMKQKGRKIVRANGGQAYISNIYNFNYADQYLEVTLTAKTLDEKTKVQSILYYLEGTSEGHAYKSEVKEQKADADGQIYFVIDYDFQGYLYAKAKEENGLMSARFIRSDLFVLNKTKATSKLQKTTSPTETDKVQTTVVTVPSFSSQASARESYTEIATTEERTTERKTEKKRVIIDDTAPVLIGVEKGTVLAYDDVGLKEIRIEADGKKIPFKRKNDRLYFKKAEGKARITAIDKAGNETSIIF